MICSRPYALQSDSRTWTAHSYFSTKSIVSQTPVAARPLHIDDDYVVASRFKLGTYYNNITASVPAPFESVSMGFPYRRRGHCTLSFIVRFWCVSSVFVSFRDPYESRYINTRGEWTHLKHVRFAREKLESSNTLQYLAQRRASCNNVTYASYCIYVGIQ